MRKGRYNKERIGNRSYLFGDNGYTHGKIYDLDLVNKGEYQFWATTDDDGASRKIDNYMDCFDEIN